MFGLLKSKSIQIINKMAKFSSTIQTLGDNWLPVVW